MRAIAEGAKLLKAIEAFIRAAALRGCFVFLCLARRRF